MSYQKNTPGQKFNVLAISTATGLPVTGDAANITAQISIDSGAFAAVTDTNPTEADATNAPGVYVFDLTQAETNGDVITIVPSSTTANVQLDMINIYTAVFQYKPFGLDSRIPTFLCDDVSLFWYLSIYGADGTAKDADSNPTINYRLDNDATLRSFGITVTKVSATTGLYKVQHNLAGLGNINDNTFIGYEESAVIDGVTYVNRWAGVVRSVATKTQSMDIENKVDDILVDTTAIDSKTSQLTFTVPNQVDANSLTGGTSPADIYTYFTDGTREDVFKANITSLATLSAQTSQTNTLSTISETLDDAYNNTSTIISVTDQFRFTVPNQVDSNSLTGGTSPADIYTYFTDGTREEVFRADVTAIQNVTDQFRFTVSNQVDANALTGGYPSGPGGIPTEIDIQSAGVPLDGAAVWISTDTAGAHVIAGTLYTHAQGKVTFMLEAGDYYVWVQHSSVNFNNPSALTVTG